MSYGTLFSSKLVAQGRFQEAIDTASRELASEASVPESLFNRGQALAALGRLEEAVADFERAFGGDLEESGVEPEAVDDELFDALKRLALARSAEPEEAVGFLERYRRVAPAGRHVGDIEKWVNHLRGVPTVWHRERV